MRSVYVYVCVAAAILIGPLVALSSSAETAMAQPAGSTATEGEVRLTCGTACHAYPPATILPRSAWPGAIARMELLRRGETEPPGPPGELNRSVDLPADMGRVLRFYMAGAPEALGPLGHWPPVDPGSSLRFRKRAFSPARTSRAPAISNVQFLDLERDCTQEIVATDMGAGFVMVGRPADHQHDRLEIIADTPHPARTTLVDLDGDGHDDLLVANLGSFLPGDHQRGGVAWLRRVGEGQYAALDMTGFPRVADVQAGPFTGSGGIDLLVGAFGWRSTGFIALMPNLTRDYAQPSFETYRLDERPGAIHIVPVDLNRDGHLDFIALLAQQHEAVIAFLNDGSGHFRQEPIHRAPHPNWGYSGMQVVDFDGDGDLDVLVTNGDSFDDFILKPYHGIEWLENPGRFPFVRHRLAQLPGAHRAVAVDLDGDGDLDVVASALVALVEPDEARGLPSLVWLERTAGGRFVRHTLERGAPIHATLDASDFDADGDVDLVVGNLTTAVAGRRPSVELWENLNVP